MSETEATDTPVALTLQELFDRWLSAEDSLIGEMSCSISRDIAKLNELARVTADEMGLLYRD